MEIKTKKILDQILFAEEEKNFMRTLADTIQEECKNHDSCETCPFIKSAPDFCYCSCTDFAEFLEAFADAGSIARDE